MNITKMIITITLGLFCFLLSTSTTDIFSGPIYEAYKKTEAEIANLEFDPKTQERQLKETLLKSLQAALVRFYNYEDYAEVSVGDITYEAGEETKYTYYFQYKNFLGYFVYSQDPRLYFLYPFQQNMVVKPGTKVPRFTTTVDDWEDLEEEEDVSPAENLSPADKKK